MQVERSAANQNYFYVFLFNPVGCDSRYVDVHPFNIFEFHADPRSEWQVGGMRSNGTSTF